MHHVVTYTLNFVVFHFAMAGITKKEYQKRFGSHVKQLREAKGLSKIALADLLGKDRQMVQALERGERNPTMFTIIKLADALEVAPGELFDFIKPKLK